uniref:Transthyretin-like family protein n=1 Tax=Heterorhabditis bacteriophora TaxID=37862 RepID=A0A1I7XRE1_HETBA
MRTFILICTLISTISMLGIPEQHTGKQSYRVKGILMCGKIPAKEVVVKLVDDDFGPDADDELDSGFTDANGFFELAGFTTERTTIDPHLKFYHDCNDGIIVKGYEVITTRSSKDMSN